MAYRSKKMADNQNLQTTMESEAKNSVSILSHTSTNKISNILARFHPHRDEIFCVVRTLNGIGVDSKIIGASLSLHGWKTFFGSSEWTSKDVYNVLNYLAHKDGRMNTSSFVTGLHK
jgi:hypothetical protein